MRIEKLTPQYTPDWRPETFVGETLVIDPDASDELRLKLVRVVATAKGYARIFLCPV